MKASLQWPYLSFALATLATVFLFAGCDSLGSAPAPLSSAAPSSASPLPSPSPARPGLEAEMDAALQAVDSGLGDFSFVVEDGSGYRYAFDRGASSMDTVYRSASTSKLVSSVVILSLVDRGFLSLDDHPQDWIDSSVWTIPSSDPLYGITLAQLLSFTSCLEADPADGDAYTVLQNQVRDIAAANAGMGKTAGTEFYYGSWHLQVAGLMAVNARRAGNGGSGYAAWNDVFSEFKARTSLFGASAYDLPSASNPRLAGGMHWTGNDYLAFLRALSRGELLGKAAMDALLADHTPSASVSIVYSPIQLAPPNGLGECWHYGLGLWQECRNGVSYDGTPGDRVSSPGAYGAYPFWDRVHGYYGIVARDEGLGSFPDGISIERTVEGLLASWASP